MYYIKIVFFAISFLNFPSPSLAESVNQQNKGIKKHKLMIFA